MLNLSGCFFYKINQYDYGIKIKNRALEIFEPFEIPEYYHSKQ